MPSKGFATVAGRLRSSAAGCLHSTHLTHSRSLVQALPARVGCAHPMQTPPSRSAEFHDGVPFKELKRSQRRLPCRVFVIQYILSLGLAVSAVTFSSRTRWGLLGAANHQPSHGSSQAASALFKSVAVSPGCRVEGDTPRPIMTSAGNRCWSMCAQQQHGAVRCLSLENVRIAGCSLRGPTS